ncbi:MAG TPA: GNAT family N-acetyltransferase [Caldilineaceae bacterium]|nr:GNAT family N-acetyltransferase [Caldilineaceae bacterium]
MMTIRPFEPTDQEYATRVAIHNAVWPAEPTTIDYMRFRDRVWPQEYFIQRLVAEVNGQIVATANYCETHWSYRPGKYDIRINVHPDHQGQGIGRAIYDHMMAELAKRPGTLTMLTSLTQEDRPAVIRFLTNRGFQQQMRFPSSALAVDQFDPTPFAGAVHRMTTRGIHIATLAELQQRDPDWQAHVWELDCTCTLDEPLPDAFSPPTLAQYIAEELETPSFLPEAWFMALDGDRYVGMAVLYKDFADPDHLQAGFTAVRREYRRLGIATALKLRAIDFAKQYGAKRITTGNEEHNPMYQINLRLGFQPLPAKLAFQKELPSDA